MIEDNRLKIFMTVARCGSFTRAAYELGITQPAVSQNIAELEKSVGASLFDRSRNAVSLTGKGKVFMEYAGKIAHWYDAANSMFDSAERGSRSEPIVIEVDDYSMECLIPRLITTLNSMDKGISCIIKRYGKDNSADLSINTVPRKAALDLASSATLAGIVQAAAIAADGSRIKDITSLDDLPAGFSIAVWAPYTSLLPPDTYAKVSFSSPSISSIKALVGQSPTVAGIIPWPSASPLSILRIPLPNLRLDLHVKPSDSFAGSPLFTIIQSLIQQFNRV